MLVAQYPNPGTINTDSYTFIAENSGTLTIYSIASTAGDTSEVGLLINGMDVGSYFLNNHTATQGDSQSFPVSAGDGLVFVLHNITKSATYYSDETMNPDGQHIYSEPFPGDDTIPAGTYIGFEDRPLSSGDKSYNDLQIVFTIEATQPPTDVHKLYDVSLAWDHSVSENVTGYRIYYGHESGIYDTHEEFGYVNQATISGLEPGLYFFAATALDAEGNESGYSNEVSTSLGSADECKKEDMNCDGVINVLDVQALVNIVNQQEY